jgi:integrase
MTQSLCSKICLVLWANSYVFPAACGVQLSDMALTAVVRRMHEADTKKGGEGWSRPRSGRVVVVHGFRSTFRDWTAEMGYDREMAEWHLPTSLEVLSNAPIVEQI